MAEAEVPKEKKEKERCLNVILVGDCSVGKTAIIRRYVQKSFNNEHITTLGLDFMNGTYHSPENKDVQVKIWDTAGQERFRTLTTGFYKKADGIVICFDVTAQKTFDGINDWVEQIKENANPKVPIILVGNKTECEDPARVISKAQGEKEVEK